MTHDDNLKTMKIKALAPWFGSKRNLAPRIVELLGPHRVYWEPFCGSMAVLLVKPPCVMETVNDLHGDLINLAKVVQDRQLGPQLYRRLRRTMMSEQLFSEAAIRVVGGVCRRDVPCNIERAYDFFVCSWLGRNGTVGEAGHLRGLKSKRRGFCVRFTSSGGHAAKRWQSAIHSIPAWRRRLANVTILQRDAFGLLERIEDRKGTAIYIDPPYLEKGAKYVYDFEGADHVRLAELLHRFKLTRLVVSYYDHPLLAKLYPGWARHEIAVPKALANQGSRGTKNVKAKEVLLVNSAAK